MHSFTHFRSKSFPQIDGKKDRIDHNTAGQNNGRPAKKDALIEEKIDQKLYCNAKDGCGRYGNNGFHDHGAF